MKLAEAVAGLRAGGLECARGIAEYYVNNQSRYRDVYPGAGVFPSTIDRLGRPNGSVTNWQLAFASMAMLAAGRAFDSGLYRQSAGKMINYLRTLQIFDPYHMKHYGAIRETTPLCPWCYVRDALSGAWGFLEYFRFSGEAEYLERAKLWYEWYVKQGSDVNDLPLWGVAFDPPLSDGTPPMLDSYLGDFSGGSFNFFYQLYKATGDNRYIGTAFRNFADFYLANVQKEDGFFKTVCKNDGAVPESDPQGGLHKSNDDFSSLGLLSVYRATGDRRYLDGVAKFISGVMKTQQPDGSFEKTVAGIPVVLNILQEAEPDLGPWPKSHLAGAAAAMEFLFSRRNDGVINPNQRGGIDEYGEGATCTRSMAYALIALLKLFAGETRFLTAAN